MSMRPMMRTTLQLAFIHNDMVLTINTTPSPLRATFYSRRINELLKDEMKERKQQKQKEYHQENKSDWDEYLGNIYGPGLPM